MSTVQLLKLRHEVEAKLFAAAKQGRLTAQETLAVYNLASQRIRTAQPKAPKAKAPNWSRN